MDEQDPTLSMIAYKTYHSMEVADEPVMHQLPLRK